MTGKRGRTREEPDPPAAGGRFEQMTERMKCGCAKMMPQMMSMCGRVPNDEKETATDAIPEG